VITTKSDSRSGQQVLLGFKASKKIGSKERTSELGQDGPAERPADGSGVRRAVLHLRERRSLADIETDTNAALRERDDSGGVVLDGEQRYVYERGNWMNDITLDVSTTSAGAAESEA
jgi:hypothetical protein